jgi:hypothetical protein
MTPEAIMYNDNFLDTKKGAKNMLLFDKTISIRIGNLKTGENLGLQIFTSIRQLDMCAMSRFHLFCVVDVLIRSLELCPYIQENRFKSFAPIREHNHAE